MSLFSDAAGSLLDTIIVGVLRRITVNIKKLLIGKKERIQSYISAREINRQLYSHFEIIETGR